MNQTNVNQPAEAPDIEKRLHFNRAQLVGIPLLLLLPLLAIFGVFGESWAHTSASNDTFDVRIEYPTRYRYKMLNSMVVTVTNVSAQEIQTATVSFDATYISRFSTVVFLPTAEEITEDTYDVLLTKIEPDGVRKVTVELQGERYGWHRGAVSVSSENSAGVRANIDTIIFP